MFFKMNFLIRKIKYYLNPAFIEKHSVYGSIRYLLTTYKKELQNKNLLDLGCGSCPYRRSFEELNIDYKGIDFKNYSPNSSFESKEPEFYFDESYKENFKLPYIKNESYGIITAFQVLEHHENIDILFSEASRILKKGGYLILSFPFIWELHEEPNDFQRLTHYKIQKYCSKYNLRIIEQTKRGGAISTVSQLINLSLFNTRLPKIFVMAVYLVFLLPLQYFAYILDCIFSGPNKKIFLGYTFLIQKV